MLSKKSKVHCKVETTLMSREKVNAIRKLQDNGFNKEIRKYKTRKNIVN